MKKRKPIRTVDEYISQQPKAFAQHLKKLRSTIKSAVPGAEEVISYQVPCFKYSGYLVGMGVTRTGCSLYVMSWRLARGLEAGGHDISGTTLHFPLNKPLPVGLIKRVVRTRVMENRARASRKKKKNLSARREQ